MSDDPSPPLRSAPSPDLKKNPAPANTTRHVSGIIFWVVILIVLVVAGLLFLRHHGQAQATAASRGGMGRGGFGTGPSTITTTTAYQGDIGIYVNALGSVTPLNTVNISSRVQGQIVKISYQEGQLVKVGDPLLEIDPGPNQAALTQAQGQLERDNALLEDARLDLQRYQAAFASNAIPEQQLDTQIALVHQDEGTVKLDQGLLDNAKVQLAYCYITSPLDGRVGLRLVDQGNIVQANSTNLAIITELQPISVIFDVAEDYLPQIQKQLRKGKKLTVDVFDRDLTKKLATGTLETVDNQISPATGTIQLRAIFTNDDESLFPNQFVNARLLVDTLQNVTLLPNTAIQRNADSAFVYTLSSPTNTDSAAVPTGTNQPPVEKIVNMQTITVGVTDGNVSEVEGIDPGTPVAADNFNKLADGEKVIVRPSTESTNAPARTGKHRHKSQAAQ
jgi:multidrug efflux system membrane fusion protein